MRRTSDVPLDILKILEEYSLLILLEHLKVYYQNQVIKYTFESEEELFEAEDFELEDANLNRQNLLAIEKAIEILKEEIEFDLTKSTLSV